MQREIDDQFAIRVGIAARRIFARSDLARLIGQEQLDMIVWRSRDEVVQFVARQGQAQHIGRQCLPRFDRKHPAAGVVADSVNDRMVHLRPFAT